MLLHFERKNSCLLFNFRKKRVILWTGYYRCMQVKFSFILLILYCYLVFLTACYKWRILLQTFCSGSDGISACFLFCIVGYVISCLFWLLTCSFLLQFFETVVRYDRFFTTQTQHIPTVLVRNWKCHVHVIEKLDARCIRDNLAYHGYSEM